MIDKQYILVFFVSILFVNVLFAQDLDSVIDLGLNKYPAWKNTSAISEIKREGIQTNFTNSLVKSLGGKVHGLSVDIHNNEPGVKNVASLYVRGRSTFSSGTQPLVIVDGFEGFMDKILPHEIESIKILKDAASTTIYGDRGANGVILINTRKGRMESLEINLNIKHGIQTPTALPKYLGATSYMHLYNEALYNDGIKKLYNQEDFDGYENNASPYLYPDVNWYDVLLKERMPLSNYYLHFNGGNKVARYFALLNVLRDGGIFKNTENLSGTLSSDDYTQYNFRSNVDINVNKSLLASLYISGAVGEKNSMGGENTNSIFDLISNIPPNAFPVYNPNGSYGGNQLYVNPVGELQSKYHTVDDRMLSVNFRLTQNLGSVLEGLSVSSGVSFNNYHASYTMQEKGYRRFSLTEHNTSSFLYTAFGDESPISKDESNADRWQNFTFDAMVNYDRNYGKHDVDGVLMFKVSDKQQSYDYFPYRHALLGGSLLYGYGEKYLTSFSFSYDGSYEFSSKEKFAFYPAVSLGWIVTNENFFKDNNIISYLKLRTSYGLTGNDNIGASRRFLYNEFYYPALSYYFGSSNSSHSGLSESSLRNVNVTRERQKEFNFGAEIQLLNTLDLQVDLFKRKRYNILTKTHDRYSAYLGLESPELNVGEVENSGMEVSISYKYNSNNFSLGATMNAWYAENKILNNAEAMNLYSYLYKRGHPIGQPFVLESLGFFKDQDDIQNSPTQGFGTVRPGDIKYKDQNNDGIINDNDMFPIGLPSLAKLNAGIDLFIRYKNFAVSVFVNGVSGGTVSLDPKYYKAIQNQSNVSDLALNRWTENMADVATFPRLSSINNENNFKASTLWQRKRDFLKLQNIELSYEIPKRTLSVLGIQSSRLYVSGNNLWTIDHMEGLGDPQLVHGRYPALRSYNLGVDIKF